MPSKKHTKKNSVHSGPPSAKEPTREIIPNLMQDVDQAAQYHQDSPPFEDRPTIKSMIK